MNSGSNYELLSSTFDNLYKIPHADSYCLIRILRSGQTDVVSSEYSDRIFGKLYVYVYVWKIWPSSFQKEYSVFAEHSVFCRTFGHFAEYYAKFDQFLAKKSLEIDQVFGKIAYYSGKIPNIRQNTDYSARNRMFVRIRIYGLSKARIFVYVGRTILPFRLATVL